MGAVRLNLKVNPDWYWTEWSIPSLYSALGMSPTLQPLAEIDYRSLRRLAKISDKPSQTVKS